jgi:hypothetical protein
MNHSIYGTNRTTHLKIVVVALAVAIAVANLAIDLLKNRYRGQGGQPDHAMSGSIRPTPRSEAHHDNPHPSWPPTALVSEVSSS